jgi:hypothetical protein
MVNNGPSAIRNHNYSGPANGSDIKNAFFGNDKGNDYGGFNNNYGDNNNYGGNNSFGGNNDFNRSNNYGGNNNYGGQSNQNNSGNKYMFDDVFLWGPYSSQNPNFDLSFRKMDRNN